MKLIFTRHALVRCRERGIRINDIKATLRNLARSTSLGGGLIQMTHRVRGKTLNIIFKTERDKRIIITAYYED